MKRKLLLFVIGMIWTGMSYAGTYSGGSGTSNDPYQIADLDDLWEFSQTPDDWEAGKYFIQTANIDATYTSNWSTGTGWTPVGNSTYRFYGSYDGGGHTISGLYINRAAAYQGFFGYVLNGTIKDLGIVNANITATGNQQYVGALAGMLDGASASVDNCYSSGAVKGYYYRIGGLIGQMQNSCTLTNSYSSANVDGGGSSQRTGGFVGQIQGSAVVSKCYSTGNVTNVWGQSAAFIGFHGGTINDCYCTGNISRASGSTDTQIALFSYNYWYTNNCYTTGDVFYTDATDPTDRGFLAETPEGTFVNDCFYNKTTSNQTTALGATGITDAEMKTKTTFTNAGWNFTTIWAMKSDYNNGYPNLDGENDLPYSGGSGTSGDPYQIANLDDLQELSTTTADWAAGKYFIQTADIDASATSGWNDGAGFSPIGISTAKFYGSYNGQNHQISNLYVDREGLSQVSGFFGWIDGANISNLYLIDVDITSGNWETGGITGYCVASNITNCHVSGTISGNAYLAGVAANISTTSTITNCSFEGTINSSSNIAAGIVGQTNDATDKISKCWSSGSITSTNYVSGIVAYSRGEIENCYTTASLTGAASGKGGIVGYAHNTSASTKVINCYSAVPYAKCIGSGTLSQVTSSYYDGTLANSSGDNYGATGKTTAEMKTQSTFTDWDFANVWQIESITAISYPFLQDNAQSPAPGHVAATFTWDGSADNDWNTAANWNLNAVPTAADNVIITTDGNAPSIYNDGTGASCNNLTINSGATLTINNGGSLITNGTITNNGTVNMEQEFTSLDQWELISMPASGITANTFLGMYLQQWNETTGSWSDITSPSTPLTPVKGFSYYAKAYSGKPAGYTLTYTGTPNTGNQSLAITASGTGGSYNGANLLGNPYPSYLDWNLVSGYGTKYTWNGSDYEEYTESGIGSGNRYVEPMQGFFIVANAAMITATSGTFSLTNSMRTHTSSKKSGDEKALQNSIVLSAFGNDYEDQLWLVLDEQASEAFELQNDAWKLLSSTEGISQLWSVSSSGKLAVDVRPQTETIQLGFTNDVAGIYTIGVSEIADITTAVLEDTKANLFHDLTKGAYEFAWDLTDDESRFKLHLGVTGIESLHQQNNNLLMYASGQTIYLKAIEGRASGLFTMTDMSGRILMHKELDFSGLMTIPVNVKPGVYVVSLTSDVSSAIKKVVIQ